MRRKILPTEIVRASDVPNDSRSLCNKIRAGVEVQLIEAAVVVDVVYLELSTIRRGAQDVKVEVGLTQTARG